MRTTRRNICIGLLLLATATTATAACSEGEKAVRSAMVDYAVGDWSCELTYPGLEAAGTIMADATVTSDDDTNGSYALDLTFDGGAGFSPRFEGEWELDGTELTFDMSGFDAAVQYAVGDVELDTDAIQILENAPGSPVVDVDIERNGDTVDFSWHDPSMDEPAEMSCTKG